MKVYCSGPLFCPEELGGMTAISNTLEAAGYETFLPHRDGVEAWVMGIVNSPLNANILKIRDIVDRAIFALDIYQIVEVCDCIVFNANGRVPDEGGVVETAIAFATGTPIVMYKNDARTVFKGRDNSMLSGLTGGVYVHAIDAIPAAVQKSLVATAEFGQQNIPPNLQQTLITGKRVWRLLQGLGKFRGQQPDNDRFVKEIERICKEDNETFGTG